MPCCDSSGGVKAGDRGTAIPEYMRYIATEPGDPFSTASPLAMLWDDVQVAQADRAQQPPHTLPALRCEVLNEQRTACTQSDLAFMHSFHSHGRLAHLTTRHCLARSASAAAALASTRSAASCRRLSMAARSPASCTTHAHTAVRQAQHIRHVMPHRLRQARLWQGAGESASAAGVPTAVAPEGRVVISTCSLVCASSVYISSAWLHELGWLPAWMAVLPAALPPLPVRDSCT